MCSIERRALLQRSAGWIPSIFEKLLAKIVGRVDKEICEIRVEFPGVRRKTLQGGHENKI